MNPRMLQGSVNLSINEDAITRSISSRTEIASKVVHGLGDVLITHKLADRLDRGESRDAEKTALAHLARHMSHGTDAILQAVCQLGLALCKAESSGISILSDDENEGFTWNAMAGKLDSFIGGKAPRYNSPCGVCLEHRSPQLFSYPERHFEWLRAAGVPVVEGLVVPLYKENRKPWGTIWIMMHTDVHRFDAEDVRMMMVLSGHACAALRVMASQQ